MKVRFPPSPTGSMHIGTARALLFNYLFAKKNGAKIVFRSEDTDRERSKLEFETEILNGLKWLGLEFDEGPYRQSERYSVYEKRFEELKKTGSIYPCFCSAAELAAERADQEQHKLPPGYSGRCRSLTPEQISEFEEAGRQPVWRFGVAKFAATNKSLSFTDLVRGQITEDLNLLADFVIRKADGQFLYHFCVVADDAEMQITHVIRGEDHISNTFKHILLFQALGAPVPEFAHLPLLLNKDKSKMSKRDESGRPMTLARLQEDGYLPAAVTNYLALLGWNPGDAREFFSLTELTQAFDIARVQKAGAVFDLERLQFFNQHYLRALPVDEFVQLIRPYLGEQATKFESMLAPAAAPIQEKIKYLAEAPQLLNFFFSEELEYENNLFTHAKMQVDLAGARVALEKSLPVLEQIPAEQWNLENIQTQLLALVAELKLKNGQVLWPLRVALTGLPFSPGTFEVAATLGRDRTINRIKKAIDKLK